MRARGFVVGVSLAALLAATPGLTPVAYASTVDTKKPAADPTPTADPSPSPSPVGGDDAPVRASCALYPIALPADVLAGTEAGTTVDALPLGTGPGNFSWLSWTGASNAPALAASLIPPGNKEAYVDPDGVDDGRPDVGDWIPAVPGVKNSKAIRNAMDALEGSAIVVPTWSEARGTGANLEYEVAGFAQVRLVDYRLNGHGWLTFDYLGPASCYNSPPSATGQSVSTDNATPVVVALDATDPDGDPITFEITTGPVHGAVSLDGASATYTPEPGYVGPDSFAFVASDGLAVSEPAVVSIDVTRVNHPPAFTTSPPSTVAEGDPYAYPAAASDEDGDALTYSLVSGPAGLAIDSTTGAVTGNVDGAAATESLAGENALCRAFTFDSSTLDPALLWHWQSSTPGLSSNLTGPAMVARIVDVNGDGVVDEKDPPTVVFGAALEGNPNAGYLVALNGATGEELWVSTDIRISWTGSVAVGDITGDGRPEIVAVAADHRQTIVAFDSEGHPIWQAATGYLVRGSADPRDSVSIADLDGDGSPEVIHGNRVFSGEGERLWSGNSEAGGYTDYGISSIVADLDGDGHQEVLAGRAVYNWDGTVRARNRLLPAEGFDAVADFDGDGSPEIVMVGGGRVYLLNADMDIIWGPVKIPGGGHGGPPTIGDMTGDGVPEIGIAGYDHYVAIDADGTILWSSVTHDYTSSRTGSSIFDFQGNGRSSVLYADERNVYIFDGPTGAVQWTTPNNSGTTYEYPVVADVTGDGRANVLVSTDGYQGPLTGLRVFASGTVPWMPTRSIWNQHAYSITNVNDDGSIPAHPVPSWIASNTYRVNELTDRLAFAAPDLAVRGLRYVDGYPYPTIEATVENRGLADYAGTTTARFYSVDASGAKTPLDSVTVPPLAAGESTTVSLDGVVPTRLGERVRAEIVGDGEELQCNTANDWAEAFVVGIRVEDPFGGSDEQYGLVDVTSDTPSAPVIVSTPPSTGVVGEVYDATVEVLDANRGDQHRFSLDGAPPGMWIDGVTGRILWNLGAGTEGTYTVTARVEDLVGACRERGLHADDRASRRRPRAARHRHRSRDAGGDRRRVPVPGGRPGGADGRDVLPGRRPVGDGGRRRHRPGDLDADAGSGGRPLRRGARGGRRRPGHGPGVRRARPGGGEQPPAEVRLQPRDARGAGRDVLLRRARRRPGRRERRLLALGGPGRPDRRRDDRRGLVADHRG